MVRTLLVTASLVVVLSLAILGARLIGTAQPAPAFAQLFTNPDGTPCQRPCMFGIRVGETTFEQARQLLHLHSLTRNLYEETEANHIVMYASNASLWVFKNVKGTVTGIYLDNHNNLSYLEQLGRSIDYFAATKASSGEIVSVLGSPNYVRGFGRYGDADFVYDYGEICIGLQVRASAQRITVSGFLVDMSLGLSSEMECKSPLYRSWMGFSTPQRYDVKPYEDELG